MFKYLMFFAPVLAACAPVDYGQCQRAKSYGEMFGTPETKGPCWGRTISQADTGNVRAYMFEMNLPYYAVGSATYQGTKMIQASVTQ